MIPPLNCPQMDSEILEFFKIAKADEYRDAVSKFLFQEFNIDHIFFF